MRAGRARRAERAAIACGEDVSPEVVRYLNRLSDLLFILSRGANAGDEPLWEPGELPLTPALTAGRWPLAASRGAASGSGPTPAASRVPMELAPITNVSWSRT